MTDEQKAIRAFLGDRPDAAQWRAWRETLEDRLRRLRAEEIPTEPAASVRLAARIAELKRQIAVLEQEELVTEFVEESVKATLAMGSAVDGAMEDAE
jgi:hypothetical protein